MGLMNFKKNIAQEVFGKDVESFSEGINREIEQSAKKEYEQIARSSFTFPNFAKEEIGKFIKKKGKKADLICDYVAGNKVYKPPFSEEWLELRDGTKEELEKALTDYEKEHDCAVGHYVKFYENFAGWCEDETDETKSVMVPICFVCGAVVTSFMDRCPCCGDAFYEDDSEEDDSEEEWNEDDSEETFCSECGTKLEMDTKFCTKCGKQLQLNRAFCSCCGTKLEAGSKFCPSCGEAVR